MSPLSRRKLIGTGAAVSASMLVFGNPTNVLGAQDADKPTVVVGSKDVTETIILAELSALLLEDAGYKVERQLNLGGTMVAHDATVNGDVDTYVEYTGTAILAILDMEIPEATEPSDSSTPEAESGNDPVYDIVAQAYPDRFGIEWLKPWGFNNTYVVAVRGDTAEELGLETITDLEGHAGNMVFGGTQEFLVRPDGLPALEDKYGIEFGDTLGLDQGLMYSGIDRGEVDIISATSTDGRLASLGLVSLVDDRGFFPNYYAAPVVRSDMLEKSPEVADVLNRLAGQVSESDMSDMNFQVDDGREEPVDVARRFLQEKGLIEQ